MKCIYRVKTLYDKEFPIEQIFRYNKLNIFFLFSQNFHKNLIYNELLTYQTPFLYLFKFPFINQYIYIYCIEIELN